MPLRFAIVNRVSKGWSAELGWCVSTRRAVKREGGTYIILGTAGYVPGEQSTTERPVGVEQDAMRVTRREALTNTR